MVCIPDMQALRLSYLITGNELPLQRPTNSS